MSSSLLLLVNCGDGGAIDSDSATSKFKIKSNALLAQKNVSIQCIDQKECPEYALGIVGVREVTNKNNKEYEVYGCSGTLIEKDVILTNRHCLPIASSRVGDKCEGLEILFAQTQSQDAEKVSCKEVLAISNDFTGDTADKPDWVILRLKKSLNRKTATTNNSGVPAFEKLVSYPVTFSIIGVDENKNMYATIQKNSCHARMDHLLSVKYNHPKSYNLAGVCDYNVINGNSGSALFNENQEILGLMAAGVQKVATDENATFYFGRKIDFPRLSFTGTNLHCIPYFNQSRDAACAYNQYAYSDNIGEDMSKMHAQHINEKESTKLNEYLKNNDAIRWEPHSSNFINALFVDSAVKELQKRVEYPSYIYAKEYSLRQTFPYTPKCISLNHADKGVVEFMLPLMLQDRKLSFVSRDNFYSLPLFLEELPMIAEYNANLKKFAVKIAYPALSDEQQSLWMKKRAELLTQYNTCVTAKDVQICEIYAQLEDSFNTWIDTIKLSLPQRNAVELEIKNQLFNDTTLPTSYVESCNN
ncbi:MAG: trypsin-like serine protease [Bdellovibrionota bacterium]|nr:trypsin-like serine protease [Bdellovibrionota bacterium]